MTTVQQYDKNRWDIYRDGGFLGSVSISQVDGFYFEKGMIDYLDKDEVANITSEVFVQWVCAGCP
jgi:hypothetical protein